MDERDKEVVRRLYDLQVQRYERQGEEIAALKRANDALQRSHDVIGEMLRLTADLLRPH